MSPSSPVCRSDPQHHRRVHETGGRLTKAGDLHKIARDDGVNLSGGYSIDVSVDQPRCQRSRSLNLGRAEVAAHRELSCHTDRFGGGAEPPKHTAEIARRCELLATLRLLIWCTSLVRQADTVFAKVKPGSRKGPLVEVDSNGELTIYVREPAVDGRANAAAIRLLAAHLQLPRSRVELVSGATSRLKRFRIRR
jgi:uncharacterized protein YggU (UPF0235/DUF167 family)